MKEQKLMTATQAAKQLKVGEATLANWRSAGTGPVYIKVGGSVRYRMSDLDKWLDSRSVVPDRNPAVPDKAKAINPSAKAIAPRAKGKRGERQHTR